MPENQHFCNALLRRKVLPEDQQSPARPHRPFRVRLADQRASPGRELSDKALDPDGEPGPAGREPVRRQPAKGVVLARWLALNPRVLIVDEPTRGIDIAAEERGPSPPVRTGRGRHRCRRDLLRTARTDCVCLIGS